MTFFFSCKVHLKKNVCVVREINSFFFFGKGVK